MKKCQRDIYQKLIDLPSDGFGLCNICRYAVWNGDCEDADLECHCGIWEVEESADDVWQGNDCWVFRPRWLLEDIADMVGIFLRKEHPDMSNCKEFIPLKLKIGT